jgi:hypothetical protein
MKLQHLLSFAILASLVYGCGCDAPEIIDLGRLPDSVLTQVPYQDGQTYKFRNSRGQIFNFTATRTSHDEYLECEKCCKIGYKYQVNQTILTPEYPLFDLTIQLSSIDSADYGHFIWVGAYLFYLPKNDLGDTDIEYSDSLQLNNHWFHGVYQMKYPDDPIYISDSVYPSRLYYNFNSGIIQITLNNGEYYQKNE